MPMMKGTSMMSLGTWTARSNKYQTFINVSNVFLLIASTVLLFSSGVLINFYHLTKVKFLMFACNESPPPPPKIKANEQPKNNVYMGLLYKRKLPQSYNQI